jgi:signal transduction histidine kinase
MSWMAFSTVLLPGPCLLLSSLYFTLPQALILMALAGVGVWAWMAWRRRQKVLTGELVSQKETTRQLRHRTRVLERILAVSTRLNATRNPVELNQRIVEAARDISGFGRCVMYLWSDETKAFEARAFAGFNDLEKSRLAEDQVVMSRYREISSARFRYSNCYLVAPESAWDELSGTEGRSEGNWRQGQVLAAPLITPQGEELGYLSLEAPAEGLVPDVVDIRQLEFLISQAVTAMESAEVYERLARNNADLQVASEKLKSLNDMKNNFVANVSHELRTPLTSISAYSEILQHDPGSMSDSVREEFLSVIHTESQKLSTVINDILELNSMENGRSQAKQSEVDIVQLAQRLVESWKSRALERGIALELVCSLNSMQMVADEILIKQLLGHLLGNAFKFTPDGGRVQLKILETGTAIKLVVEDTGIGIPEDQLVDIFDRFYQVDGSATRQHNGQGVGLAICQDIVKHHDGRIWAENAKDQGARFTVLLPCRTPVLQPVDPQAASASPFQPGEFMQRVMHWVSGSVAVQTATLMMPDRDGDHLTIRAAIGLPESVVQSTRVRRGKGIAGRVWESGETLLVEDVTVDESYGRELNEPRYSTSSLLSVPLIRDGICHGVLSVNNRVDGQPLDEDDRLLLESLAPLLTEMLLRHSAWQDDSRHFANIRDTLRAITTVGHYRQENLIETCQEICLAAARRINLPDEELQHLAFALEFYDVGLAFVPHQLLNKPGPLEPEERRVVQEHVSKCLDVLEPLDTDSKVRQMILHHHENFDGSGYPVGLAGEAIPLGSRLLRLADTLAALLSPRPWRPAHDFDKAMAEIQEGVGSLYCPRMTEVFQAEAELRRDRVLFQQQQGMDHRVFKRAVLDPQHM